MNWIAIPYYTKGDYHFLMELFTGMRIISSHPETGHP